ncbi:MAG TPA: GNAT family N-acetyltransferase, partial [Dehalococcoidia bacterium]|nr:GNAT family N-acetyltransferase [Dehalococcoidia bacterium]
MINDAINIREATRQDTDQIVQFQQSMAQEAEGKSLDEPLLRRGVASVFDSDDKGFYLVAEADGEVVGSLLITYEWSDWRN